MGPGGWRSGVDRLKGTQVRIPKGTLIRSLHPQDPLDWFPLKRATTITVFGSGQGHLVDPYNRPRERFYSHAELTWPGSGGYWRRVKLRDVEILSDLDIPPVTPAELAAFDATLATALAAPTAPVLT
jgi:hypothetical protein